jgi:hypothetical protein
LPKPPKLRCTKNPHDPVNTVELLATDKEILDTKAIKMMAPMTMIADGFLRLCTARSY